MTPFGSAVIATVVLTIVWLTARRRVEGRRALTVPVAVGWCVLLAAGCSSGGSSPTPEALPPADPTTDAAGCPFTGTIAATQGSGQASGAVISKVTPSKTGCIDNVTAAFSTAPPSWSVAYQDGPFVDAKTGAAVPVPGPVMLVVTFSATTYPKLPGGATPATLDPGGLDYVQGVSVVTGQGGSLQWIVSLPEKLQYTTSVSNVPAEFILGIG
jgi:hypothetical protein